MTSLQIQAQQELKRIKAWRAEIRAKDALFGLIPGVGWAIKALLSVDDRWDQYMRELQEVLDGERHQMPDYPDNTIS